MTLGRQALNFKLGEKATAQEAQLLFRLCYQSYSNEKLPINFRCRLRHHHHASFSITLSNRFPVHLTVNFFDGAQGFLLLTNSSSPRDHSPQSPSVRPPTETS